MDGGPPEVIPAPTRAREYKVIDDDVTGARSRCAGLGWAESRISWENFGKLKTPCKSDSRIQVDYLDLYMKVLPSRRRDRGRP